MSTAKAPRAQLPACLVQGANTVDEAPALPHEPAWVGKVLQVVASGVQLVTPTGYAWIAAPGDLRPAGDDERAAYDAQVRGFWRERARLYRQLVGDSRS
ncbi:hypothetical protein [Streptomyces albus]|uniref:Uncharacterized protein n=1 Tax=Streptomyces albus TaxID=1888 RepID=A0A8H1LKG6_9ACTN|nr:hypothetical protein [Streptomyces albus]TGG89436.1 hypothetical protein D8771_00540 [Streptomyces albus]UVN57138.1 hypothetical protein NR995_23455 [Streptomyces albus]